MRIPTRRGHAAVPEGGLQQMHRGTPIERMRPVAVPEPMRRDVLFSPRPPRRLGHDPERLRRAQRGAFAGDKHRRILASGATYGAERLPRARKQQHVTGLAPFWDA